MVECALCGGFVDATDIINNTCSECFEIFQYSPNGNPTDMSEKIVAMAEAPPFSVGNRTSYWVGPTATVASGVDIPIFVTTPDELNENLGTAASIYTRNSDTEISIDNDGIHSVNLTFLSTKNDTFTFKINGTDWLTTAGNEQHFSITYSFTAGDLITVTRVGLSTALISFVTVSVARNSG